MTTPTPKTSRPSNADLQAMIEQQAAQIAALLAIASRAAETAPAPAPAPAPKTTATKTAPATIAPPDHVKWISIAQGMFKPWNTTQLERHRVPVNRRALVTDKGRPIIDIPLSIETAGSKVDGGAPIPEKYIHTDILATLTPSQLKSAGLSLRHGLIHYSPK